MAGSTSDAMPKHRVGRPRAQPSPVVTNPHDDLLAAAAHLFSTVGYAGATTRDLANLAGLRQPSMFYYFRRKEDLLAELLDRTVQPTLAYIDWLARQRGPAEVKLFELIGNDVQNICSGSYNLTALYLLPEAKAERFAEFWDKRGRLSSYYQHLIVSGRRSRAFKVNDVELATKFVFGAVESVATWFDRNSGEDPATVGLDVAECDQWSFGQPLVPEMITRAVLRDTNELDTIRAAADSLRAQPDRPDPRNYPAPIAHGTGPA